jgi:hypothetical protein
VPSDFVPSQPPQLTANSIQSPYFYRANGLLQIAVSALLRTNSVGAIELRLRSTADTALEILRKPRIVHGETRVPWPTSYKHLL